MLERPPEEQCNMEKNMFYTKSQDAFASKKPLSINTKEPACNSNLPVQISTNRYCFEHTFSQLLKASMRPKCLEILQELLFSVKMAIKVDNFDQKNKRAH
jgi:hypothetical protein